MKRNKIVILICLCVLVILGCTKEKDYSYLNTKRNCKYFVRVSERYKLDWSPLPTKKGNPEGACDSAIIWAQAIRDTTFWPMTCPPPIFSMPDFRIEIVYYEEVIPY